jgi:hypothetical protein
MATGKHLSRKQLQELLGISRGTAMRLIGAGHFPGATQIPTPTGAKKPWRVPQADIDAFLHSNRIPQEIAA